MPVLFDACHRLAGGLDDGIKCIKSLKFKEKFGALF